MVSSFWVKISVNYIESILEPKEKTFYRLLMYSIKSKAILSRMIRVSFSGDVGEEKYSGYQ